jgi:hypothetical protein
LDTSAALLIRGIAQIGQGTVSIVAELIGSPRSISARWRTRHGTTSNFLPSAASDKVRPGEKRVKPVLVRSVSLCAAAN